MDRAACTPGFVIRRSCPRRSGNHPSTSAVADALQRPTQALGRTALNHALSGLAPGGVYLASPVTWGTGGLLHHRFTLTCVGLAAVRAVCSLWHFPAGHPEWALPTTPSCGARTFLEPLARRAVAQLPYPCPSLQAGATASAPHLAAANHVRRRNLAWVPGLTPVTQRRVPTVTPQTPGRAGRRPEPHPAPRPDLRPGLRRRARGTGAGGRRPFPP